MGLHRLAAVTIAVPNVDETKDYYTDFGLAPDSDGWFSTADGGRQLRIVHAPTRRLIEMELGADDDDDIGRIAGKLHAIGVHFDREPQRVSAIEPHHRGARNCRCHRPHRSADGPGDRLQRTRTARTVWTTSARRTCVPVLYDLESSDTPC